MKKKTAPRPSFTNTRKALRKQKRQEKKVHRQEHYLKKKSVQNAPAFVPGRFVKRPVESTESQSVPKAKKQKVQPSIQEVLKKERQKELNQANKLKSQMDERRKKMLLEANDDEDKIIKKLEKQLGLSKSKNKNKNFANDGLDYLLDICDRATTEQIVAAEKHLANAENESDFEEDLAAVTGKETTSKKDKKKEKTNADDLQNSDMSEDEDETMSDNIDESGDDINYNLSGDEIEDDDLSGDALDDDFEDESDVSEASEDEEPEEKPIKRKKEKEMEKPKKDNKKEEPKRPVKEKVISEEELSKVFSDDEVSHLSGDDEDMEGFSDESGNEKNETKEINIEKPDVWEDIYGRKRDKEGNVIKEEKGTYIPPHLRNKNAGADANLTLLKRQIKSVTNKLTGTNLHWACSSVEALYGSHSRHSVSEALAAVWADAAVGAATALANMLAEHAALVAVLHANVGVEIGAYFLEVLTRQFDELMRSPQPLEDKTLDNLVSCLAHLYSYKIYHAALLYDILNRLMEKFSEKNVDCILAVLRSVGGVLRKDSPEALKQFIQDTQSRVQRANEQASDGSRIKFLLEVLMAIKNNNLNKIPNYDPTYTEHLKKMIRGIIRKGNYITPLNIRLEDLLKAHERGKWWVVGSAWEGDPTRQEAKPEAKLPSTDQKLLELARKQRMNTDVRRSIFCVIMAAEDYMDAFEKLQHLSLRGPQEREVAPVLLACCLQENNYNPYYAVLALKLCDFDRKYQLSIQYSVWDKIKEIESLSKQSLVNLAQFLIHLILEKGLALSVLKVIEFSDLNKQTVKFMRQILLAIIMNADLQASLEVFHRISKSPKLHMFRESLKLFIQHFLIRNAGKKSSILSEDEMATLRERTLEVNKILTMHESKLKF